MLSAVSETSQGESEGTSCEACGHRVPEGEGACQIDLMVSVIIPKERQSHCSNGRDSRLETGVLVESDGADLETLTLQQAFS